MCFDWSNCTATVANKLQNGGRAMASGNFMAAIHELRTGLNLLGNSYFEADTLDDTGMHMALAGVEERRGRFREAAFLLKSALSTRLSLFEDKARRISESCKTLSPDITP